MFLTLNYKLEADVINFYRLAGRIYGIKDVM